MTNDLEKHLRILSELDLYFEDDVYYQKLGNGEKDGPFCSCCFDFNEKLVRLHKNLDQNNERDYKLLVCPKCKTKVLENDI